MPTPTSLAGLRVLVTRPAGRETELCSALEAAGAAVFRLPLMQVKPLNSAEQQSIIQVGETLIEQLDSYSAVIFISVNAVEYGLKTLAERWPSWPDTAQVYAIGKATAAALRERDIAVQCSSDTMDSEGLLAVEPLQAIDGQRVLIIRGVGGRALLAERLAARGAKVEYLECYQRMAPDLREEAVAALIADNDINVVCLNSGETVDNFYALQGLQGSEKFNLLLPSARVVAIARQYNYKNIVQADNAGTEASVAALQSLQERYL